MTCSSSYDAGTKAYGESLTARSYGRLLARPGDGPRPENTDDFWPDRRS